MTEARYEAFKFTCPACGKDRRLDFEDRWGQVQRTVKCSMCWPLIKKRFDIECNATVGVYKTKTGYQIRVNDKVVPSTLTYKEVP